MLKDFREFLMRGNVVDLAVAVVIGAAFSAIVSAIATGLITPFVGMIISKDFSEMTFEINGSVFSYGLVVDALIKFVSYAAVIFFLILKPMEKLAERRRAGAVEPDEGPAPSDEALLLAEIRDLLATRQS
jgi:large conductance mechanosensitive channel